MAKRISDLEDELKQRDRRIDELRKQLNDADALISEMREQVEDSGALINQWIEAFDMAQNEAGEWATTSWIKNLQAIQERYMVLLRKWNHYSQAQHRTP
jgi:predicted  nucleic acid-binding Zn-ribbon protein